MAALRVTEPGGAGRAGACDSPPPRAACWRAAARAREAAGGAVRGEGVAVHAVGSCGSVGRSALAALAR